ncbi:MAG: ATP-binding protein [Rhodobacteraceae bacterium]|nr:ATP-binding protein [Paracoccaceae bacterium]
MARLLPRSLLPRGLYGRAMLILIVPIVTIQLVVSIVFLQRHFAGVTRQMTDTVEREIRLVAGTLDNPAATASDIALLSRRLDLSVSRPPQRDPVARRLAFDLSGRVMSDELTAALPGITAIDLSNTRVVTLWLETEAGLAQIAFDRRRVSASNPHQLLVLMVFTGLLMTFIAILFMRNQLRPIRRLARAAEAFGTGRIETYKPAGATEVRAAGRAFLEMRARIERQIEQRTMMLSGVSHDLRTPLTRLKLALSLQPETDETRAMLHDVAEMEQLIDGFLDFARGTAADTEPEPVDPVALVREIVDKAQRVGQAVELGACVGTGTAPLRRLAVARAVENLVGNALRYGSLARVSVTMEADSLRIAVEDDGPGIPPERRDEAMRPFIRLDAARNQDRGSGAGLGLAIAADVARSHGGRLILGDSTGLGGLRAELVLSR